MSRRAGYWLLAILGGCTPFRDAPNYQPAALERARLSPQAQGTSPMHADSKTASEMQPMTLDDCVRTALQNNRTVVIADRRILIARDRVSEAVARTLPQLSFEGRFTSRNNDPGFQGVDASLTNQLGGALARATANRFLERHGFAPLAGGGTASASRGGVSGILAERDVWTAKASLLVPIYDFGRSKYIQEAEEGRVDVARHDAARERQDLILSVSQAYYRDLEAQKIKTVVEESIGVVQRQLEIARDFLSQGLVAANDVLAAEVQLAQRQQELIQAENNVQLAIATLNRLIGVDVTQSTEVLDVLEVEPWQGRFTDALMLAIRERPDLASLRRQIEIARDEYRATRADGTAPRVYGFADYNWSSDDFLLNNEWLSGGIAVQIPIFDGGVTIALLKRQRKEIAESVDRHDERVDDIVLDIKKAYLNVRESAERIPVARKSVNLARENLRIVRDQYDQGLLTSADVLTEEDRLARTRTNYFQALYDYHESYARLANNIGAEPPPSNETVEP